MFCAEREGAWGGGGGRGEGGRGEWGGGGTGRQDTVFYTIPTCFILQFLCLHVVKRIYF
jgi:hypothetical protein